MSMKTLKRSHFAPKSVQNAKNVQKKIASAFCFETLIKTLLRGLVVDDGHGESAGSASADAIEPQNASLRSALLAQKTA